MFWHSFGAHVHCEEETEEEKLEGWQKKKKKGNTGERLHVPCWFGWGVSLTCGASLAI